MRIRNLQLRFRGLPVALGLAVSAAAVFFTMTGNTMAVFALIPAALVCWMLYLRPAHRARYRRAIAELPRWDLHPVPAEIGAELKHSSPEGE